MDHRTPLRDTSPMPAGTVTAMFTDIVESTRQKKLMQADTAAGRDAEYRTRVKEPHDERVLALAQRHHGRFVNAAGDGYLFAFTEVEQAVLCALAIQESLLKDPIRTPTGPLALRIGIHTGTAVPTDQGYTAAMMDKASRVQSQASPGEVYISEETQVLVAELRGVRFDKLPAHDLKGLGPCTLFRVHRPSSSTDGGTAKVATVPLRDLDNPYDFAATANRRTYKGRVQEMEELLDSIETGTHTAIFGLQRMGKTSLIEQGLKNELKLRPALHDQILIAAVDMQRLGGAQVTYRDFVHAILDAIVAGLGRDVPNLKSLTAELFAAGQYQRGDRTEFFSVLTKTISRLATVSRRRIVLFIDEFSEIRRVIERNNIALNKNPARTANLLPHEMYLDVPFMRHLSSLLRDETLKQQITFIVLVRPFIAEYDEREGLQLLKLMKPITLRHLDDAAAKALITKPIEGAVVVNDDAVEYLVQLTAGHPYLLQFMLKLIVDKIKRLDQSTITVDDVKWVEARMISDGPAYDAQFAVLISDYSVDEITHPKEAQLGKGLLALVSELGQRQQGWVSKRQIYQEFTRYKIPEAKTESLLSQLTRTSILKASEGDDDEPVRYRLSIPLVQERFVKQNWYRKYFRDT